MRHTNHRAPASVPAGFQLESLPYQQEAMQAVVDVFEGTPPQGSQDLGHADTGQHHCPLTEDALRANLKAVSGRHQIDEEKLNLQLPATGEALELCIEMETGTGKTLVYLHTLYALHTAYGWGKFIIVVPSVAIRAGVMGTLKDFGAQLAAKHGLKYPIPSFEYDSARLQQLDQFIDSPLPSIMVMNSQAFVGEGRVISNEENEAPLEGLTRLQALALCRPIVVMDEPQEGMDTAAALKAFADMQPLVKLRYSATHKNMRNCVYRLTPAQAYQQGLVKKIEVLTIDEQNAAGLLQLELHDGYAKAGHMPQAKLRLWYRNKVGDLQLKLSPLLKQGLDLAVHTANASYAGYRIESIEKPFGEEWTVKFSNGVSLIKGQHSGDQEGIFRQQLHWLIQRHFEKKARLAPLGIKCLSLIFIDKVGNYLQLDLAETPLIKRLFEEELSAKLKSQKGQTPTADEIQSVQGSYFAQTGQGKWTDSDASMAKNSAIYKRILTDKAGLLRLDDPIEFIFSHSALGVGWDNPNVFNIATLNVTHSESKKRQELGRGLRICVNEHGHRVYDAQDTPINQEINLLTVVPNLSYQQFSEGYQQEIDEAYGLGNEKAAPMRHNKAGKPQIQSYARREDLVALKAFQQFWKSLARTTHYSVEFDEAKIIEEVVPKLQQISLSGYQAEVTGVRLGYLENAQASQAELTGTFTGNTQRQLKAHFAPQDWVKAIGQDSRLSQKSVLRILQRAFENEDCAKQFMRNPVVFAQKASQLIRHEEREFMLRGLHYWPTGAVLPLETLHAVLDTVGQVAHTPQRGLYAAQPIDSDFEKRFAEAADKDIQLTCLLKLPSGYRVPTPVGDYNPDFGLVFKQSGHRAMELAADTDLESEFFVVEVKATHDLNDKKVLRDDEILKIRCAAEHFKALGFVVHLDGRVLHVQPSVNARHFAAPHDTYLHFKQVDMNRGVD